MENKLQGIIPPLLTPSTLDGKLDVAALERIINHCIDGGVGGIFILGSCGEGSVLTQEDRLLLVKEAMRIINNRVPMLVGVLESSTRKVIAEIKLYEMYGAKHFVVAPPYYLQAMGQDHIYQHYESISKSTSSWIIAYNIPGCVHTDLLPETFARLHNDFENIIAVKDSTNDWTLLQKLLFKKKDIGFNVLCGSEELCGTGMLFGGDGAVPCMANIYPRFFVEMYMAAKAKDSDKVYEMQKILDDLKNVISCGGFWVSVYKYLATLNDLMCEHTFIPGTALNEQQKAFIKTTLEKIKTKHPLLSGSLLQTKYNVPRI